MAEEQSVGAAPADWYPDPTGRHQYRYWDGATWTEHVADGGESGLDPLATADERSSLVLGAAEEAKAREQWLAEAVKGTKDYFWIRLMIDPHNTVKGRSVKNVPLLKQTFPGADDAFLAALAQYAKSVPSNETPQEAEASEHAFQAFKDRYIAEFAERNMGQEPKLSAADTTATGIPSDASALISEAIDIIEGQVTIQPGAIRVEGSGSEGKVMEAANKLQEAHNLHPQNPLLHFGWASALHLAAQFKSAEDEMKAIVQLHPDFLLARFAIAGWERWKSPFTLPSWTPQTEGVPPAIAEIVKTTVLLSVREGLSPRATLFLRDASGDFQDLNALRSAKIDITSVVSPVKTPQLMAIYVKIWDNLQSPYEVEELGAPLRLPGDPSRCTFEYLCLQQDIDFVVLDNNNKILLNKRLTMPSRMREANQQLLGLLESTAGQEVSTSELVGAMQSHQRQMSPSSVSF